LNISVKASTEAWRKGREDTFCITFTMLVFPELEVPLRIMAGIYDAFSSGVVTRSGEMCWRTMSAVMTTF
jgi:hypothetical protein